MGNFLSIAEFIGSSGEASGYQRRNAHLFNHENRTLLSDYDQSDRWDGKPLAPQRRSQQHELLARLVSITDDQPDLTAARLLDEFGSIAGVIESSPTSLSRILGECDTLSLILTVQAIRIEAISDCLQTQAFDPRNRVISSALIEMMSRLKQEEMHAIYLGPSFQFEGTALIARGSRSALTATYREIFQKVFERESRSLILVHNHMSGNPLPSGADIAFTKRLFAVGRSLDTNILDHLIVGGKSIYSMAAGSIL